jgi:chromosome partitioning protein
MSTIVAIVNEKGGVGKTVSTSSLGSALARRGQRVLLVDLDPQEASLSIATGVHEPAASVADVLQHYITRREAAPLEEYVTPLGPNLDLLPNSKGLASAEHVLANVRRREYVLAEVLAPAAARYDTILIDCPPSLGVLVVNALTAADVVLIPVVPEYMAVIGIKGLLDTVREMRREKLNPRLTVGGIILTMVDTRTRHSREVSEDVRAAFGDEIPILGEVRRSTRVNEAMQAGQSILDYAERDTAAQAYLAIADELLARWAAASTKAEIETEVARG